MNKKERRRALAWLRAYRSPIADVVEHKDLANGWTMFSYQKMAVISETVDPTWSADIQRWTIVRRDTDLLGFCPSCHATMPVILNRPGNQRGAMVHADDCIVSDSGFKAVLGDQVK